MKCIKCNHTSVKNDLCKDHYLEYKDEIYLDNTTICPERGILKWAKEMLPHAMPQATPEFHYLLYQAFLSLYNPLYRNKYERLINLISWRGSAKSMVFNMIIPMYLIAMNGKTMKLTINGIVTECLVKESYVIIASETGDMAEDFTVRIRDEYSTNRNLKYYYSFMIEDAFDAVAAEWTKKAFKINGIFFLGIGIGQQARGRIKGVSRPSLVIADDIYSEKNTATQRSRAKVRSWWNKTIINSVDDLLGKILMAGTIVHEDTVNIDVKKNKQWKTIFMPLMTLKKFELFIKQYLKTNANTYDVFLPYENETDETIRITKQREFFLQVQNGYDWELSWPERVDLYYIAIKYKEAASNKQTSAFYQEYFHITISESEKRFKRAMFQPMGEWEIIKRGLYTFIKWPRIYGEIPKSVHLELGLDISGGKEGNDEVSLTIGGSLSDRKRIVLRNVAGAFSIRDILYEENDYDRLDKVIMDRLYVSRIGFIDEAFRLVRELGIKVVKIGVAGEENQIADELERVFRKNGDYITRFIQRKQSSIEGSKAERVKSNLLHLYEPMMVYHAAGLEELEHQLEFLSKTDHDDRADSLEVAMYNMEECYEIPYVSFEEPLQEALETKDRNPRFFKVNNGITNKWKYN